MRVGSQGRRTGMVQGGMKSRVLPRGAGLRVIGTAPIGSF